MGTPTIIRDLLLGAAVAGFFLYVPAPGFSGFVARAQAQTTAPATSAGGGAPVAMAAIQGTSQQVGLDAKPNCADQLGAVDAERNYPGPLLDMAQEDLAACQGKVAP